MKTAQPGWLEWFDLLNLRKEEASRQTQVGEISQNMGVMNSTKRKAALKRQTEQNRMRPDVGPLKATV